MGREQRALFKTMKIVVDTNIVFSAILNTNSKIGDLLMNSESIFEFRSVMYLKDEIEKHEEKLMTISSGAKSRYHSSFAASFSDLLRCSSVTESRYAPSSRLAGRKNSLPKLWCYLDFAPLVFRKCRSNNP